jgi:hypothetical protein
MALNLTGMMEKELSSSELSVFDLVRGFTITAMDAGLLLTALGSGEPLLIGGRDIPALSPIMVKLGWREAVREVGSDVKDAKTQQSTLAQGRCTANSNAESARKTSAGKPR